MLPERSDTRLEPASGYESLYALARGILVLAAALVTHANLFLAAFSAGVTVVTISPQFKEAFHELGELLTELLKLAAILVFGAPISLSFLGEIGFSGYVFALFALVLVRPLALLISLASSRLIRTQRLRLGGLRPPGAGVRRGAVGRDLPPRCAGRSRLGTGPLFERHVRGPSVS